MLHFVTSHMKQNKNRKQTLEGAQYGRKSALNEDLRKNINHDVVEKGGDLVTGYFLKSSSEIELKKGQHTVQFKNYFSKLVACTIKSMPPDQNISNRMISVLYDFCNFSSVYGHG